MGVRVGNPWSNLMVVLVVAMAILCGLAVAAPPNGGKEGKTTPIPDKKPQQQSRIEIQHIQPLAAVILTLKKEQDAPLLCHSTRKDKIMMCNATTHVCGKITLEQRDPDSKSEKDQQIVIKGCQPRGAADCIRKVFGRSCIVIDEYDLISHIMVKECKEHPIVNFATPPDVRIEACYCNKNHCNGANGIIDSMKADLIIIGLIVAFATGFIIG